MADLMADTGASAVQARAAARAMLGEDAADVVLPLRERPLIRLVLGAAGQWRMAPMGLAGARPVAFDMTAVDATARWLGIAPDPAIFEGLAIMEAEALKLMRNPR